MAADGSMILEVVPFLTPLFAETLVVLSDVRTDDCLLVVLHAYEHC